MVKLRVNLLVAFSGGTSLLNFEGFETFASFVECKLFI
jgi:hypothetical protein